MVITMAKLRMAHTSTHGARKLPWPKTPGTKVGPGFLDRTLAVKSRKNTNNNDKLCLQTSPQKANANCLDR